MVVKTKRGFVVYNEDKKRVGGPFKTRKEANEKAVPACVVPEGGAYGGRNTKD